MDFVKQFIEKTLYPIMEVKNGNNIRRNIKELKITQGFSGQQLLEFQNEKLKNLLIESINNVPAYQQYSYLENEINTSTQSAFSKFPILDKGNFKENSDLYINQTVSRQNLIANRTGGSTSEPVRFYIDRYTVEYYEAARWRGLSWWGITPGSRSVMIWGNPLELNQVEQKKYRFKEKWLKNRIIIPAYALKPEAMNDYVKSINKFNPEYIYGYASALYAFSLMMLQQKLELSNKLKAVVSTAETLHDFQREAITKAFGAPVVNEYGARDGGILAYECSHGSMHISAENAVIEVVDPITLKTCNSGQSGILLVTDLNNFSAPRLRYQVGDRGILSKETCKCGIGLPVLDRIDGREDDMFVTVTGQLVHGHAFNHVSRSLNAVKKFQIIQLSPAQAELSIIKSDDGNNDELDQFITGIKEILPGTQIDIKYVDDIPLSDSGKFRYAIRKFALNTEKQ